MSTTKMTSSTPRPDIVATTANGTFNATEAAGALFISPVPFYGTIIIASVCCVLFVFCIVSLCIHLCRKKPPRTKKERPLVGTGPQFNTRKESVQPDMEDLIDDDDKKEQSPEFVGKLHYSIEYSISNSSLTVTVVEARGLKAMDIGGTSDPYVKIKLLPKKKPVYSTKIIKKNLNPLFNETFVFEVMSSEIASRTVLFHVFDHDAVGKDDLIGHLSVPLGKLDLSRTIVEWQDLEKPGDEHMPEASPGDVCISLRYVAATGTLTVVVLEAKNLPTNENGNEPDSFVKLTLKHENKKVKQKKTTVRKACINPYFNETFTFDIQLQLIRSVVLDVAMASPGRIRSKTLGRVELGAAVSNAPQAQHWNDVLANPRHPIARWHQLQRSEPDQ